MFIYVNIVEGPTIEVKIAAPSNGRAIRDADLLAINNGKLRFRRRVHSAHSPVVAEELSLLPQAIIAFATPKYLTIATAYVHIIANWESFVKPITPRLWKSTSAAFLYRQRNIGPESQPDTCLPESHYWGGSVRFGCCAVRTNCICSNC